MTGAPGRDDLTSAPHPARSGRGRRLAIRGSAGLLGAGLLIVGAVQVAGFLGDGGPKRATSLAERPPLSVAAATATIAASAAGRSTLADAMREAEVTRKREMARQHRARRLDRVRHEEQRRAKALAANQLVSSPSTATPVQRSAPAAPADPWADVSPMVRQTTPGPWNNGGATS